jgi:hypothetical protein
VRSLAERLDGHEAVDVVFFREDGAAIARRDRDEVRFGPNDDEPLSRAWAALANPNAGDVLVSAKEGYEFTDLGGRHHSGGGSHGSLCAGDSEVPMLAVGLDAPPASITEIAPAVVARLAVAAGVA